VAGGEAEGLFAWLTGLGGWLAVGLGGWLLAELVLLVRYMFHFSFPEFIYRTDPGQRAGILTRTSSILLHCNYSTPLLPGVSTRTGNAGEPRIEGGRQRGLKRHEDAHHHGCVANGPAR
jgi:hypothetical protein